MRKRDDRRKLVAKGKSKSAARTAAECRSINDDVLQFHTRLPLLRIRVKRPR